MHKIIKHIFILSLVSLSFSKIVAQNTVDITQYYEAYKQSYGIFDVGLNTPKGQELEFQVFEKTATYIKFGIDKMNLYIEMSLFQGQNEWKHFVIMHKYFNQDFRTSIQSLECLTLNQTPIGNPLDKTEDFPKDEMLAYYYQNVAFLQTGHFFGTDDKKDLNYQKIMLPKNGENTITLVYAKPKLQNGAIVEAMKFENGKAFVQLDVKFTVWATLSFQQKHSIFDFEAQ